MSEDLIKRSDAIETAYQLRHKPNDAEWEDWLKSFNAIPSADRPQGWIPCSERLPERNGVYLVTVQNAEEGWAFVIHAWFNIEIPLVYGRKGWTPLNEFYDLANQIRPDIVAWMPLPEPWKGATDGNK